MTELMKRHIEEGGDCKISVYVSCALPNVKRYIEWLEAQLTWRPVGEKPKEGQIVFAMIPTGWVVSQYLNGKFYVDDGFNFGDMIGGVTNWLPIPPVPEGE